MNDSEYIVEKLKPLNKELVDSFIKHKLDVTEASGIVLDWTMPGSVRERILYYNHGLFLLNEYERTTDGKWLYLRTLNSVDHFKY